MRIPAFVFGLASLTLMAARPLQVDDLFKVKRVADPQISAKGDQAWQVGVQDVAANKVIWKLWFKAAGQAAQELDLGTGSQTRPRFSPDGTKLAYQTGGQIWVVDLATKEKKALTSLSGGASGQLWSPDGTRLAFVSTTVPSGVEAENEAYLKAQKERKATGRLFDGLMYRHWMDYRDARQVSHLFVVKADGSEAPKDVTAGWTHDVPNAAGVDSNDGYAWAPDGKALAFSSHPEFEKGVSTNGEVYEVPATGGAPKLLSGVNPAMDNSPSYSPDGKYLAWRAQRRPGFEADKWELWVMDRATGKVVRTTQAYDLRVESYAWSGADVIFTSDCKGQRLLYRWDGQSAPKAITEKTYVEAFTLSPDGKTALAQVTHTALPPDLFSVDLASGKLSRVTSHNQALAEELSLNRAEPLWVKGGAGKDGKAPQVLAWVVKPVGFDPAKKYPVAFIIHGGPQGAWSDNWHFRWNAQSWAGRGFITVLPNPRGSEGFGQKFTDEISGDWSGLVMKDLLSVLEGTFKAYPNAERSKVVAAGGSYGGYAVNWIAGHYPEKFAAFVCHAGIFNTQSMQLATEELWFPKWEFKGFPWDSPATKALWEKHSPHNAYMNFKKPMLVIHGEQDYRVVYTDALQLYNMHQLKGIPSQLLLFPDEGHFVAKPANSKLWYETVLNWFDRWAK